MFKIDYIPTLTTLRELYSKLRNMTRFNWYIEQITGTNEAGKLDIVMPIGDVNPMGREHCLAAVERLIAFDTDGVAANAAKEAAQRLSLDQVDLHARVFINLLDDLRGGWTQRHFKEAGYRYSSELGIRANRERHFVLVAIWASEVERFSPDHVRQQTLDVVYRYTHMQQQGRPITLRQMMALDRLAAQFAGITEPTLDTDDLAYTREVIAPHLDATDAPTQLVCLFGDECAEATGYPKMGLSPRAGVALAIHEWKVESA